MEANEFRRFYSLNIARFAFTLMIAVFHYWAFYNVNSRGGFIAVEFFFILSGFMLMEQAAGPRGEMTPGQFLLARVKKYYPHYIFSFMVIFLARTIIVDRVAFTQLPSLLAGQAAEIFMLHGTILSDEHTLFYNHVTWYLSILLAVGYVLWALLKRHKEALITAAPIVSFWIYAYMAYTLKTTNNWSTHVFSVCNYALLRGVAGMLLGVLTWHWHSLLNEQAIGKTIRGGYYSPRYSGACCSLRGQLHMVRDEQLSLCCSICCGNRSALFRRAAWRQAAGTASKRCCLDVQNLLEHLSESSPCSECIQISHSQIPDMGSSAVSFESNRLFRVYNGAG